MLRVPKQLIDRVRFQDVEESGYLIAHDNIDITVTNVTKPDRGTSIQASPDHIEHALNELESNSKFTTIPYHTYPTETPSPMNTFQEDSWTLYAVGTPTRTLFFCAYRGKTYPITAYLVSVNSRLKVLSDRISEQMNKLGIEMYSL